MPSMQRYPNPGANPLSLDQFILSTDPGSCPSRCCPVGTSFNGSTCISSEDTGFICPSGTRLEDNLCVSSHGHDNYSLAMLIVLTSSTLKRALYIDYGCVGLLSVTYYPLTSKLQIHNHHFMISHK